MIGVVGRKKTVCLYLDAELLAEAAELAKARGTSLSGFVEEALRLYVIYARLVQPKREAAPPTPQTPSQPPAHPPLQNNVWVSVLRARG
ncbi:MAG: ribbon-helix-helix protein, CopG family [Pyrobaculum sp.]|nr:ribbon-helix-helix protein, CopG family [Pyrobaculum sp.]